MALRQSDAFFDHHSPVLFESIIAAESDRAPAPGSRHSLPPTLDSRGGEQSVRHGLHRQDRCFGLSQGSNKDRGQVQLLEVGHHLVEKIQEFGCHGLRRDRLTGREDLQHKEDHMHYPEVVGRDQAHLRRSNHKQVRSTSSQEFLDRHGEDVDPWEFAEAVGNDGHPQQPGEHRSGLELAN